MLVIGLTGGIGTGKSEVSRILEGLGAVVISADLLGHEVYRPQTDGWRAVVETFGEDVLAPGGEVDRSRLGAAVFGDQRALARLNAITHPRIRRLLEERLRQLDEEGTEVAVVEAAILLEADWTPLVDEVWVTTVLEAEVVRRVQDRNRVGTDAIAARVRSQMSQDDRIKRADAVIDNNGSRAELIQVVRGLWTSRIIARKEIES